MKSMIVVLLVVGGVVGAYTLYPKVVPTVVSQLGNKKIPTLVKRAESSSSVGIGESQVGQVKGIMTKATDLFETVTKTGGVVGNAAIKVVSSTPSTTTDVIDVSKVVTQISDRVEAIPSNLVKQAKVEYCKKVLEDAAKVSPSPSSTP